jgi:hypothetical protein
MVAREIVGQDFTIETVERMDVTAARAIGWDARFADDAVVVNEDWMVAFPQADRIIVNIFETKT